MKLQTGNKSNGIMRAMNQFIITSGIHTEKRLVCQTTIRNKIKDILLQKIKNHAVSNIIAAGLDGRKDTTLGEKNRFFKGEKSQKQFLFHGRQKCLEFEFLIF